MTNIYYIINISFEYFLFLTENFLVYICTSKDSFLIVSEEIGVICVEVDSTSPSSPFDVSVDFELDS